MEEYDYGKRMSTVANTPLGILRSPPSLKHIHEHSLYCSLPSFQICFCRICFGTMILHQCYPRPTLQTRCVHWLVTSGVGHVTDKLKASLIREGPGSTPQRVNWMNTSEWRRVHPLRNLFYCSYTSLKWRFCHKTYIVCILAHLCVAEAWSFVSEYTVYTCESWRLHHWQMVPTDFLYGCCKLCYITWEPLWAFCT